MRIYGPVPSRRFGLSLGVDIVPMKTCPLDCIYCQLGPSEEVSVESAPFYTVEEIITDVKEALEEGPTPDVITLAGSGEPGLYTHLGELIDELKKLCEAPVLLITNGVMLTNEKFYKAALKADMLAPSLDAGDEQMFERINKPHPDVDFHGYIDALKRITHEHKGEIRLEVMLIKDINDDEQSIQKIADIIKDIRVDRIDINTPVRPPVPERGALPCNEDTLALAQKLFGEKARPIAQFEKKSVSPMRKNTFTDLDKNVRETLMRRPCTLDDICNAHSLDIETAAKIVKRLQQAGLIEANEQGEHIFFKSSSKNPTIRNIG